MSGVALPECGNCKRDRVQIACDYQRLVELLRTGEAVHAYCETCDEHRDLSLTERAQMARALNASKKRRAAV
jgi:hypothetical protein